MLDALPSHDFQDTDFYQRNSMAYVRTVATNRLSQVTKYSQDTSSKVARIKDITARIESIRCLSDNWDGYGAIIPKYKVFQNTYQFLNLLSNDISLSLQPDHISPTPYGTLQLDWRKGSSLLSVEIGVSKIGFFFPNSLTNPTLTPMASFSTAPRLLWTWLRRSISYFRLLLRRQCEEINLHITMQEVLVRGIVRPLFYNQKKAKLERNAFLPPPKRGRNDVSLYRRRYASEDICKECASNLRLTDNTYCGLAILLAHHIRDLNQLPDLGTTARVDATPLDEKDHHITDRVVCRDEPGKPFHADLIYEYIVHEGQPNTPLRRYAERLCTLAHYFADPNPNEQGWRGPELGNMHFAHK
jgi:hypothetical protein